MKKLIARTFMLMLVFAMLATMCFSASAAEVGVNEYTVVAPRASSNLPFSMIASKVTDYVDTVNSRKCFAASNLDTGVTTYGKLYSSKSGGTYKAGICYYLNGSPVYVTGLYTSAARSSGKVFDYSLAKGSLVSTYTYYAFADNQASTSYYIHGTVSVDSY